MENHTLGFDNFSRVFQDAANKYKDRLNESIQWKSVNGFIESIFYSVYDSGNDYGGELTYRQSEIANSLSNLLSTLVEGLVLSVETFRFTESDYLELCHDVLECANGSRNFLEKVGEFLLGRSGSGCREVEERLQRVVRNFLCKNEDKMSLRIKDIDDWQEKLRSCIERMDSILAEFNPEPEKEEPEPSLELEDSVLNCMQRTLGNLRSLDIPECQEEVRSIERFLRGRNYQVIWPDLSMERETLEFFVCRSSAVTENQITPCIKYGEWVVCQGELVKPETDSENMEN